jgi:hypothetical protein
MQSRDSGIEITIGQETGEPNHTPLNDTAIDDDAEPAGCLPNGVNPYHFKIMTYSFPIATAIREAAETAIELSNQPVPLMATATICNFGAELGINYKFTVEGIESTYEIIEKRGLPDEWPVLSKTKEAIAITSSAIMSTYAAFCDSVLAYDFVHQLPATYEFTQSVNMTGWKILSGITAGFVGLGRLTGEGMATYQKSREMLAGVKPEYSNTFSGYVSPTAGFVLGVFGSCSDAIMTCTGMYEVFSITAMPAKISLCALSSINGVTDYCMNGTFVIECLDTFFGSFTPEDGQLPAYQDPKVIAALVLSFAAGGLLAFTYHGLAKQALVALLKALGIDLAAATTPVLEAFACGGASSYLINATGSVYPLLYKAADKLGDSLTAIYNKVAANRNAINIEMPDGFFEQLETDTFLDMSDKEAEPIILDSSSSDDEDSEQTAPARQNSFLFRLFQEPYDYRNEINRDAYAAGTKRI